MIPVHDLGSGPALVLIPGLAATARFFEPLAADLARDHRVVIVELPGHGRNATGASAGTGTAPSLLLAAKRIAKTISSLGLRDVTLVGWSLGATVCYELLSGRAAANVAALVSVEQTPRLMVEPETEWTHAAFGGLDTAGARQLLKETATDPAGFVTNLVTASFAANSQPDPQLVAELVAQARGCDARAVRSLLVEALVQDWREWLTRLQLPTLFIHGARSQVYPTDVGNWLTQAVAGSRLVRFEASGHLPFLEERERFASVIRDFVSVRSDRSGSRSGGT
jgi:pimeloyl-ACP methyl ester carboxylesterase